MNDQLKVVEAQIVLLQNQVQKQDQLLGILFQHMLVQKQFLDQLQVKLPEAPKAAETEEKKETTLVKP